MVHSGYKHRRSARHPVAVTQVLAACPNLAFILDGTERPIQRPHMEVQA
jgi:hypothetical protein